MTDTRPDIIATRGAQMFPRLTDEELARLARFGEPRSFRAGDAVARTGQVGLGLFLILSGKIEIARNEAGARVPIVTHEHGNFMGELAQLSGRPYLAEAIALTEVEAIAIPPERLRALLIAEADLGELADPAAGRPHRCGRRSRHRRTGGRCRRAPPGQLPPAQRPPVPAPRSR
jgi:thioredoxin reductase (NADPH)